MSYATTWIMLHSKRLIEWMQTDFFYILYFLILEVRTFDLKIEQYIVPAAVLQKICYSVFWDSRLTEDQLITNRWIRPWRNIKTKYIHFETSHGHVNILEDIRCGRTKLCPSDEFLQMRYNLCKTFFDTTIDNKFF